MADQPTHPTFENEAAFWRWWDNTVLDNKGNWDNPKAITAKAGLIWFKYRRINASHSMVKSERVIVVEAAREMGYFTASGTSESS